MKTTPNHVAGALALAAYGMALPAAVGVSILFNLGESRLLLDVIPAGTLLGIVDVLAAAGLVIAATVFVAPAISRRGAALLLGMAAVALVAVVLGTGQAYRASGGPSALLRSDWVPLGLTPDTHALNTLRGSTAPWLPTLPWNPAGGY